MGSADNNRLESLAQRNKQLLGIFDKKPDFNNPNFGEGFKRSVTILEEGGVEIIYMDYDANR